MAKSPTSKEFIQDIYLRLNERIENQGIISKHLREYQEEFQLL